MTRKKYDRDIEGEAIHAVYGQDSDPDDSEEEVEPVDFETIWVDIQKYVESDIKYDLQTSWLHKWFSANEILEQLESISEEEMDYDFWDIVRNLHLPMETPYDIDKLRNHMWNVFEFVHEPFEWEVNALTIRMLRQRTKYYYIGPHTKHLSIVNPNFFRQASI